MTTDLKWVRVVAKLIELTTKGELKWSILRSKGSGSYYETDFEKQRIRIFKGKENNYNKSLIPGWYGANAEKIVLELVDDGGVKIWQFPEVVGLDSLYDSIEESIGEGRYVADQFAEKLLSE